MFFSIFLERVEKVENIFRQKIITILSKSKKMSSKNSISKVTKIKISYHLKKHKKGLRDKKKKMAR